MCNICEQYAAAGFFLKPQIELIPELDVYLDFSNGPVRFLEIGSGPHSRVGAHSSRGQIDHHCIDIKADDYQDYVKSHGLDVAPKYIRPTQGDVYALDNLFPSASFHLVFSMNLLDELDDPLAALEQMINVCRSDGTIVIYNILDRKKEQPTSFAKWSFRIEDKSIVMTREDRSVSLSSYIESKGLHVSRQCTDRFLKMRIHMPEEGYENLRLSWEQGRHETERFWRSVIKPDSKYHAEWMARMDPEKEFDSALLTHVRNFDNNKLAVLDVGAGPCTSLGYKADGIEIRLTAADYYASLFSEILEQNKITPPVKTVFADALYLTQAFSENTFDIVYSRNALDHVLDPIKGLSEMIKVAKVGGLVCVYGHANEGEREFYQGFHQWNFAVENGDLMIWRPYRKYYVSKLFRESVTMGTVWGVGSYYAVLYKIK